MKIYVIRHGESETNKAQQWTGWQDVHLTDKGKEDAKKAAAVIRDISFEKVFSSDLIRAVETAKTALPNAEIETSALLREINVGTIAGKPLGILSEEERAFVRENGYVAYGGESKSEFKDRVLLFMKNLESSAFENVAVFTHAGFMRSMLDAVIGTYIPRNKVCCHNCAVAVYEFTDATWKLFGWINVT